MITDGLDGISALLSVVFSSLGAAGVSATAGGAIAKEMGVASTDPASKLTGALFNMSTQGLGTSIVTNTAKEAGKEAVKPGAETGYAGSSKKDDWGGYGKDAVEIKNAYKPIVSTVKGWFKGSGGDAEPQTDASGGGGSSDMQPIVAQMNTITSASQRNTVDQSQERGEAQSGLETITALSPSVVKSGADLGVVQDSMIDAQQKGKGFEPKVDGLVASTVKDESTIEPITTRVNEGLNIAQEQPIVGQKKPSTFSQIKAWFSGRVTGLKGGVNRLTAWLMRGVMKFAQKFSKKDIDPTVLPQAMAEERQFAATTVQEENDNTTKFNEFQEKALKSQQGIETLSEQENS
jgi:hypothetical protein